MVYPAVLFDFDYTLGDATDAIVAGFAAGFAALGLPEPEREAVRRTVGMQVTDAYTLLTGDESEARRQTFYQHFRAVARDLQAKGQVSLFPGAGELLSALRAAGVATAVVSTKHTDTLERIFARHGLDQMFSFVIGGDRVSRPKPDPEGLTAGLARLGLTARQALYCGDTVIDAQTAQALVDDSLTVLSHQLALIPTGGEYEVLCHEFKCQAQDGTHVLIYVNAQTGKQQHILLLLEAENGTLVL